MYVQLLVVGKVDHVDILVLQFANDTVDTRSFHTHAGTYGVDTVIVRFNSYFGTLARFADDFFDGDQAVEYLGNFQLEQALQIRQSTVSQQLARLRLEGLVSSRRDGKQMYYSLAGDDVRKVIGLLVEMFCTK